MRDRAIRTQEANAPDKIRSVTSPHTFPTLRSAALILPVLALAACATQPTAPVPTATITVTAPMRPSPTPSQGADDEDAWQQPEPSFDPWQEAVWIFGKSEEAGKPLKQRSLVVIKEAHYNKNSGGLAVTLDRVKWNPKYRDGNDEAAILNPQAKWETVDLGDVTVLIDAANGFHHLERADFPAFIKADDARARSDDGDGWRTPFDIWFVGDEPVALSECYVP